VLDMHEEGACRLNTGWEYPSNLIWIMPAKGSGFGFRLEESNTAPLSGAVFFW
jgi:hypothetical protein